MDKLKVLDCTKDLKNFFVSKRVKVSEAKEIMFRLLDYIDTHYDEDSREAPFKNGIENGNKYKPKGLNGMIKVEAKKSGIRTRFN